MSVNLLKEQKFGSDHLWKNLIKNILVTKIAGLKKSRDKIVIINELSDHSSLKPIILEEDVKRISRIAPSSGLEELFRPRKNSEISVGSYVDESAGSVAHNPAALRGFLSRETAKNWSETSVSCTFFTVFARRFSRIAPSSGLEELFRPAFFADSAKQRTRGAFPTGKSHSAGHLQANMLGFSSSHKEERPYLVDRDPPIRIESLPTAALFGPLVKVKLIEGGQSLSDRRDEHISLTIRGITGHVRIDDNGDRDADYSVLDLDPITGQFEVVAHHYGETKKYNPVPGKRIHWPGGKDGPPADVPPCGFMGNDPDCNSGEMLSIVIYGVVAFFSLVLTVLVLACYASRVIP
ncbi:unnamed protein product [Bemisia tabaci]|uniref:Uncharacterized protein n=1 Tax=Bemisia tabaci TaxID=7038 RepID=A0AAI8Y627_BEMTA|nr:unnamed protein product [Bemisia tabaci]